ncbi:MAG: hypothetical protein Ct9H300mP30_0670 [Methanobacteriota archaeon]|nr:MAG: hypothetical protein Ct9H300mP30_0670 [Euryarchaeota archaeon]
MARHYPQLADQSSSALAKSLSSHRERLHRDRSGRRRRGSTSHFLGSWAALGGPPGEQRFDSPRGLIPMGCTPMTASGSSGGTRRGVLVVRPEPLPGVTSRGPLGADGEPMGLSTAGLHNVGTGEPVRIRADGVLVVMSGGTITPPLRSGSLGSARASWRPASFAGRTRGHLHDHRERHSQHHPHDPQAQPQKATRRSSTIGDMSSLCPGPVAARPRHPMPAGWPLGSVSGSWPPWIQYDKPRKIGGISDISAPT